MPSRVVASIAMVAAMLGGCVTAGQSQHHYQSHAGAPHPSHAAVLPQRQVAVVAPPPKVAVEGDGLPSQYPPRVRRLVEPDDPREPFSPNYGPTPEGPSGQEPETPAVSPYVPIRKARMTDEEADRLIGRAIAAHEARRP